MRESVARNTENIKNSGFALTALYKLVPFQPPPIQLAARFITMVSIFCWLYPPSLTNITTFCTIYENPSWCQVRQVQFRTSGIVFVKPNEWVHIWIDGYGWYKDVERVVKGSRGGV